MDVLPESNGKVCLITGLNGYIAQWIAQKLLDRGYTIRGTVRRESSIQAVFKGPWKVYKDANRIEVAIVADMTLAGAFDEVVKGAVGIFHTASPISYDPIMRYETVVQPAIDGALTLLNSALSAGPQLTSVVITSSVAAIANPQALPGTVMDEATWNEWALPKVKDLGDKAPPEMLYSASKAAAERAVWQFREEKKPFFTIVAINPTYVIGPAVILPERWQDLNVTLKTLAKIYFGEGIEKPVGPGQHVDVRDTAEVHVLAFEKGKTADGERYIALQGKGSPQAMADILHAQYPQRKNIMPIGEPEIDYIKVGNWDEVLIKNQYSYTGKKSVRDLGMTYRPFKDSLLDAARQFADKWPNQ